MLFSCFWSRACVCVIAGNVVVPDAENRQRCVGKAPGARRVFLGNAHQMNVPLLRLFFCTRVGHTVVPPFLSSARDLERRAPTKGSCACGGKAARAREGEGARVAHTSAHVWRRRAPPTPLALAYRPLVCMLCTSHCVCVEFDGLCARPRCLSVVSSFPHATASAQAGHALPPPLRPLLPFCRHPAAVSAG